MRLKNCCTITLFIVILFSLSSCRELVKDEFPDWGSSPTVNCILVVGKPMAVNLSMARKLDSLPLPAINNAEVELFVDGKFTETLENRGEGTYTSSAVVESSKEYKCKMIVPGEDTIVFSQKLPNPSSILNVEHINIAGRDQEGTTYPAIKFTFQNNINERKYFEVVIKYFYSFDNQIEQHIALLQTITDPVILNEGLLIALFSNEIIEDSIYTMTLNYFNGSATSSNGGPFRANLYPFVVELRSVTYDYYRYKKQYYLYESGRTADGLLSPVTASPLYSNIENGNGIFAGYSIFTTDTITPERYED